jgi:hypothetical protein
MIFKQFDVQCAIKWPTLRIIVATSFITKIEIKVDYITNGKLLQEVTIANVMCHIMRPILKYNILGVCPFGCPPWG